MSSPIDFRRLILCRLAELGRTRNWLAVQVRGRVSQSQIYDYLSGQSDLGSERLAILLAAVGLTLDSSERR